MAKHESIYTNSYTFDCITKYGSRGSSGNIVSDYRLDDRGPIRGRGRGFFFCSMGTGGPFPGGKARPGRDADHSPPSSAEVKYE
jgi:hypothetical protein